MAIWPFNRKKDRSDSLTGTTTELYEGENRERIGVAWLIALLSLFVTIAILGGAYLGGRWAYRKLANKDTDKTTSSQEEKQTDNESEEDKSKDSTGAGTTGDSGAAKPNQPQSSSTSTTTPQVATPADNSLPNTGPESDE